MRKIKEILRLRWELGLGYREIARSCNLSHHTVSNYVARAEAARLSWPLPEEIDDAALEALLFPVSKPSGTVQFEPDYEYVHRELRRKGVTLQLLWTEYKQQYPNGYQYSRFCELYQQWRGKLNVSLRQVHQAGEKLFVDYAGPTMTIIDPKTGEIQPAYIFVAVLGASNYTYVEASLKQDLNAWIMAHRRTFEFIGGVSKMVVPDNPKTAITKASYYDPEVNPTYLDIATHYGTVIIPARPRKPRDKAKVETGVQIVERFIMAPLRKQSFFSITELNRAVWSRLEELNAKPFQKLEGSRKSLFEALDKPALLPLPATAYEFAIWKKSKVNVDYHIELDKNFYSVSYQLIYKKVDLRITSTTVEVLHNGKRVASHPLSHGKGIFSTDPTHRPPSHAKYLEWTPERFIRWAETVGTSTTEVVHTMLASRLYPEQAYRSCMGLMRLRPILHRGWKPHLPEH